MTMTLPGMPGYTAAAPASQRYTSNAARFVQSLADEGRLDGMLGLQAQQLLDLAPSIDAGLSWGKVSIATTNLIRAWNEIAAAVHSQMSATQAADADDLAFLLGLMGAPLFPPVRPILGPAPKYSTARTPGNPTWGPLAAAVSRALGEPFMPWQTHVCDIALELDPTRPGAMRYPIVVVSVPRQSGKTTLMRAVRTTRALTTPNAAIFMTAQTGKDATRQWNKLRDRLERHRTLNQLVKARRSSGSEAITFGNSSFISPFPPIEKGLHGETTHLVDVDEAWAFGDDDGGALDQAIEPTQITVPGRQRWIISTAGTADSTWLKHYVEEGIAAVNDPDARIAYFDWSAPDGADLYDPATVAQFHPAVGYTQAIDDLMDAAKGSPGKWRRSYCNLWSAASESLVDLEDFAQLGHLEDLPDAGTWVLTYSAAEDRSGGSIWASWKTPSGTYSRLIQTGPGLAWIAPAVLELITSSTPSIIGCDDAGPTRTITAELRRVSQTVEVLKGATYAEACEAMLRGVEEGTWHHDGSPELAAAVACAVTRPMGAGRGISAQYSRGPVDSLVAAAVGAHLAAENTIPIQLF